MRRGWLMYNREKLYTILALLDRLFCAYMCLSVLSHVDDEEVGD